MSFSIAHRKHNKTVLKLGSAPQTTPKRTLTPQAGNTVGIIQHVQRDPGSLTSDDVSHLQRSVGNRAVGGLLTKAASQPSHTSSRLITQKKSANDALGFPVQRQEGMEEEVQMKVKATTAQRQGMEDEDPVQGKFEPMQLQNDEEDEVLQGKFRTSDSTVQLQGAAGAGDNRTGMPRSLKTGLEGLSGMDLSGVRVHHNSSKPEEVNALAYTQGQDIHVGPSQEKHLPHEGWHAVQQMQGRVQPTLQAKGLPINDDQGLEKEADVMGAKAIQLGGESHQISRGVDGRVESGKDSVLRRVVQREETAKDLPTPSSAGAPAKNKTKTLTLTAIYEDVPGVAKNGVKRAKEKEALWLNPLTIFSNYPLTKRASKSEGIVAGSGQRTIDTFEAPVSDKPRGRGSVTAALKYAKDKNKSFNVTVTGLTRKDTRKAERMARELIQAEITDFGDVDEIVGIVQPKVQEIYPEARVAMTVRPTRVTDAGRTTFYYKLKGDAGIQLNMMVSPVGEKHVTSSGSKTTSTGTSDEVKKKDRSSTSAEDIKKTKTDKYKKEAKSTETHEVDYNKKVVQTLEDYVSKATSVHNELASNLSKTVTKHRDATWTDHEESHRVAKNYTDYTKDSKHSIEEGEKDKSNWVSKLQKGVKVGKKITKIPYIDKIKYVGWVTRKVKGWWLDVADEVLGVFAEEGKVKFKDTKLDEKVKSKTDINDDTARDRKITLKEDDKTEVERTLSEDFKSKTNVDWERHMKDVKKTTETYRKKITKHGTTTVDKTSDETYNRDVNKDETEIDRKHTEFKNQTTTATFTVSSTWTYTKPVVEASVTSGLAEVANKPFPVETGESGNIEQRSHSPTSPSELW